jgi:hypothetical protein
MDDAQWILLIQDLKDAIKNAKDAQVRFTTNNSEYNRTITDGFKLIQNTIQDIDGLIGQLTEFIAELKSQIGDLEAAGQSSALIDEIAELKKQLSAAKAIQRDAVEAMQNSIAALNANNEAMNSSTKSQDVAGLNKTINATTTSLVEIKTRLQSLLNNTPTASPINNTPQVNPMDQQNNPLPDDTEFELPDSGENITYSDLRRVVNNKIKQITDKYGKEQVPEYLTKIYNTINAVNANKEGIQTAVDKMPFDKNGQLQGGKRKRKITKKQRQLRRNKTMKQNMKLKKGYRYNTLTKGKKYKKSKKRRNARL